MDPVEALREIAYWLERSRAATHRVKAYRRAAEVVESLSATERSERARTDTWSALPGIGAKTSLVIRQAVAGGVPEYLAERRNRSGTTISDRLSKATCTPTRTGPTVAAPSKR